MYLKVICYIWVLYLFFFFFFFQAEDGIRDLYVTGVQTCALPISSRARLRVDESFSHSTCRWRNACWSTWASLSTPWNLSVPVRSEERRVGKECRSRWSPYH